MSTLAHISRLWRQFTTKPKITFCPACKRETLRFWPTEGGRGWGDFGPSGWVGGDCKCKCGYKGYHSEEWP